MNAQNAVSEYVVMRSPKLKFEVMQRACEGIETSAYRSKLDERWIVVSEGTETECRKYRTNGQIFKEKTGYSRTLKNLLAKNNCSIEEYKVIRKARKKAEKAESKAKHDRAIAGKKVKGSAKLGTTK